MAEFGVFGALLLIVLAVLWIALPFAVFGIKNRLDRLIDAQRETNDLLRNREEPRTPL